ncbi:MAG: glycogen/starch/alpha-glucan phosphorylase [Clostridia bacterium]|nr:glycogen/starch/alpha-glucan phosphorylase [Clostridia bacterium]
MLSKTKEQIKEDFQKQLIIRFSKDVTQASPLQIYEALGKLVRNYAADYWYESKKQYSNDGIKQVHYFSMEFLLGKLLDTTLINLGIKKQCEEALAELGLKLSDIEETEIEPGLGNGGLGRLAACFLDSMSATGIPAYGQGIRYKYGLFKQKIQNGYQVEESDNWLKYDNIWEVRRDDEAVTVKFGGNVDVNIDSNGEIQVEHKNYEEVLAVPYDTPIVGYDCKNVNTLRLWSAKVIDNDIDFGEFSHGEYLKSVEKKLNTELISDVLYPDDSNDSGKKLRLKQEYFMVSAGLQSIIKKHKKLGFSMLRFNEYHSIHINDTHPSLAVAELMRILVDEENIPWATAWDITTQTMAYTNHTIMAEALEKISINLMRELLPRVFMIIEEIHRRFDDELRAKYGDDFEKFSKMSILWDNKVRMANLAIVGSHSVNGVAALHTEILKNQELKDFSDHYKGKFNNKTNGITHRRWLISANPELSNLITEAIGDCWIKDPMRLDDLTPFADDSAFCEAFRKIKHGKKIQFIDYVSKNFNIKLESHSLYSSQVKRLHAYKRQTLNILYVMHLYNQILENPDIEMQPRTFVFGAKAFSSYSLAKKVIKLIHAVANKVNNDPIVKNRIKVVFIPNYNVDMAQRIIPASDVSLQISTASKEASGTSNMKFMMNGAITLATMDGANVEIFDAVGENNIVTFGLSSEEVINYYAHGGYLSSEIYNNDPRVNKILNQLKSNFYTDDFYQFEEIFNHLVTWNDEFFVLKDFDAYVQANERLNKMYEDKPAWYRSAVINIAKSGRFSSDNTILNYAHDIWDIEPYFVK